MKYVAGLMVHILDHKDGSNYSNNGLSANYTEALLVGETVTGPMPVELAQKNGTPIVELKRGYFTGTLYAEPIDIADRQTMFGGAFIFSSDGRFGEAVRSLIEKDAKFVSDDGKHVRYFHVGAVALHDRVE